MKSSGDYGSVETLTINMEYIDEPICGHSSHATGYTKCLRPATHMKITPHFELEPNGYRITFLCDICYVNANTCMVIKIEEFLVWAILNS